MVLASVRPPPVPPAQQAAYITPAGQYELSTTTERRVAFLWTIVPFNDR
jgi:hypothetical protein